MPGASSNLRQHTVELLLATNQRINVLDRRDIRILRGDRARYRDERLAVESEIIVENENNCRSRASANPFDQSVIRQILPWVLLWVPVGDMTRGLGRWAVPV